MKLSIHQPSYFPWLGLLHKIARSDVYMVMDEVQLSDSAYQNRNLFLTCDGKVKYLTIPFDRKGYLDKPFRDLTIVDLTWPVRHRNFVISNYRKHPGFREVMPALEVFFDRKHSSLCDAVLESIRLSMEFFGIETEVILQSELQYDRSLRKGELVISLIKAAGADTYLSGTGARDYLDEAKFSGELQLEYDVFKHPAYPQRGTIEFVPGLSCLDMLFNLGVAGARNFFAGMVAR